MPEYFRKLVLKKFFKHYNVSTGFCSVKYWTNKIEKNVFDLIQAIHDEMIFAFSAVFVRMYLNCTIDHFSDLISQLSLADERKLFLKKFWFPLNLLHEFFDINYLFFHEFFNVFDEVNFSQCYVVSSNKPKFGSYGPPICSLEVIMF